MEERERACDENVLQSGSEARVYAEGILNVCEFYTESPLACVSGVTGGNLKRRIIRIMTQPLAENLSFVKKLLLAGIGIAVVAGPIMFGLGKDPQTRAQSPQSTKTDSPSFEIISIKPNHSANGGSHFDGHNGRITITNATTRDLITFAYRIRSFQLTGGPAWNDSERYDIELKEEASPVSATNQRYGVEQVVQALLADRFHLRLSQGTKMMPTYALVVGQGGPKVHRESILPGTAHVHYNVDTDDSKMFMQGVSITNLAYALTRQLNRIVVDRTGLKGHYDLTLHWTRDDQASLFTALREQLGLVLEPQTAPVPMFVIDHVEKPTEN